MRFEAGGGDAVGFEADGKAEDVSADGICHFNRRAGIGQVAGIVRSAKMVEDDFVEHRNFVQCGRREIFTSAQ